MSIMRKLFLLFAISFFIQSCCSYKSVDVNPQTMVIGQVYKIERQHKTTKAVYTRNADSAIVVLKSGVEEVIPLKDITKAREQKFSLAKTLVWVPVTIIGLSVLLLYGAS